MDNYYEYLQLDMTASGDDIAARLEQIAAQENADLQKVREIESILLSESARKVYDEKLTEHLLNKDESQTEFNDADSENAVGMNNTVLHDRYIWMAVALLTFNVLSDFIFGVNINLAINVIVMVSMLVVLIQDWNLLAQHGKSNFYKWWVLLYPVYIFKRCKAVGRGYKFFFIWMAIVVLYTVVGGLVDIGLERSA